MLDCDKPDVGEMIECLKEKPVAELTQTAGNYSVQHILFLHGPISNGFNVTGRHKYIQSKHDTVFAVIECHS